MIARLLVLTSVLVGCLTAVSGTPTLLRKDGKIQASLDLMAERGQWIRRGRQNNFFTYVGGQPEHLRASLTSLGDNNIYVITKDPTWKINPSKMSFNKKRCILGQVAVIEPEGVEESPGMKHAAFRLCAGDGVELKSKLEMDEFGNLLAYFYSKPQRTTRWAKLRYSSKRDGIVIYLPSVSDSVQTGNQVVGAYHPEVTDEDQETYEGEVIDAPAGAMQGHLQMIGFESIIKKVPIHKCSFIKKRTFVAVPKSKSLLAPVGVIHPNAWYVLDFIEDGGRWNIHWAAATRKKSRCPNGIGKIVFGKVFEGSMQRYADSLGPLPFYVCPGKGVKVHKKVKDELGTAIIFSADKAQSEGSTPAIKLFLRAPAIGDILRTGRTTSFGPVYIPALVGAKTYETAFEAKREEEEQSTDLSSDLSNSTSEEFID